MGPSGLFISIFLLVTLSAFFSLSETAVVSVPEEKIFKMSKDGNLRAKQTLKVLENKERMVSVTLFCANLATISASSLSAVCFAEWFGQLDEIGIFLSTIIMTLLIFIFGEVLPKTVALRQPTNITLIVSPLFLMLWKILYPVVSIIDVIVMKIVRMLRIGNEFSISDADDSILDTVEMYHEKGMLEKNEKKMLSGILQLDDVDMRDVMTHRNDMFAIDIGDSIENIVQKVIETQHTKIPVYNKMDDNVVGVFNALDLMKKIHEKRDSLSKDDIYSIIHRPWFLPGDSSVGSHLQEFKGRSDALAFVVDEYGGLMGIATLEDVLEEIVGDINNEEEKNDVICIKNNDGSFDVGAEMSLIDVNDEIGSNFENDEVSSIAGYLISKIDKLPEVGSSFICDGYKFTILKTTATRISEINIAKIDQQLQNENIIINNTSSKKENSEEKNDKKVTINSDITERKENYSDSNITNDSYNNDNYNNNDTYEITNLFNSSKKVVSDSENNDIDADIDNDREEKNDSKDNKEENHINNEENEYYDFFNDIKNDDDEEDDDFLLKTTITMRKKHFENVDKKNNSDNNDDTNENH